MDSLASTDALRKSYRTVEIAWKPRTRAEWDTFTAARLEAARLWNDLVTRHHRIRRLGWKWPTLSRWQHWAKGNYPNLNAQTVQQIVMDFGHAVYSAKKARAQGYNKSYPWHKPHYRDVIYTNQRRLYPGHVRLPNGRAGELRIPLPDTVALPGRLVEVCLTFGAIRLICEVLTVAQEPSGAIGVDLGINTLAAATDGQRVVLVSGRAAKATIQYRNKRLATMDARQARLVKGSRRDKRLRRRRHKVCTQARRRIRDICHKASRQIANAFPNAHVYVGAPFNGAARRIGRIQAQQVQQASTARLTRMLGYKLAGATVIDEKYSSQTCPVCGERSKHLRVYRCKHCGATGPRDAVGAVNILSLGQHGKMLPGRAIPTHCMYLRPWQRHPRSSSGGRPASSSA